LGFDALLGLVGLGWDERDDSERVELAVDVFAGIALVGADL
jgi:hypothetical protein